MLLWQCFLIACSVITAASWSSQISVGLKLITVTEILFLVTCVCSNVCNHFCLLSTLRTNSPLQPSSWNFHNILWTVKFARWRHPTVGCEASFATSGITCFYACFLEASAKVSLPVWTVCMRINGFNRRSSCYIVDWAFTVPLSTWSMSDVWSLHSLQRKQHTDHSDQTTDRMTQ